MVDEITSGRNSSVRGTRHERLRRPRSLEWHLMAPVSTDGPQPNASAPDREIHSVVSFMLPA